MKTINSINQLRTINPNNLDNYYIAEEISTEWPIEDCGESLQSIKVQSELTRLPIVLAPLPEVLASNLVLRESAVQKLLEAEKILLEKSNGELTLKVVDAFRPLSLQRRYFEQVTKELAASTGLHGRDLWLRVTEFVADPDRCPPHSTGGAVDLTIVHLKTGQPLDMGTNLNEVSELSNTDSQQLTGLAVANRKLLQTVMKSVGWTNLPTEWWHYSYGDQYWAISHGKSAAIYSSLEK